MSDQTVKKKLHVQELCGKPHYILVDEIFDDEYPQYTYLGEIEVPAVSEEVLRDLALNGINSEIAKARLVLESLEIKKQTLLAIDHKEVN